LLYTVRSPCSKVLVYSVLRQASTARADLVCNRRHNPALLGVMARVMMARSSEFAEA
jgi:hypothetical protein